MASKKKIVKPDYNGSLADYKASVSNGDQKYSPATKMPYPSNVDKGWERVVYDVSGTVAKVPFDVARGVGKLGEGLVRGTRGAVYQIVGRPTNAKPTLGVPNPNAKSAVTKDTNPKPPSKKETAERNVLNAFKGYLSIREERNSKYSDKPSNSPSFSTRERTSDITAFLADMRYKSAINDFWADKNDIKDQVNARWKEAEAQLNLRGKNLSFDPKWRQAVDKMNKKKKIR